MKIVFSLFIEFPVGYRIGARILVENRVVKSFIRFLLFLLMALFLSGALAAQSAADWFSKGLEAYRWQRMDEATGYFIKAAEANPHFPDYAFYIALCYHQSGRLADAEEAYSRSLSLGGNPDRILLRRGNLRWSMGKIQEALADFTSVVEAGGPSMSAALLNRANLELREAMYGKVVRDYTEYLKMEPNSAQRDDIEKILALLNADIEAMKLAEARRLAEEARKAEEEARRRSLMAEVLDSLSGSGEDTTSISAGSEDIREEFEDSVLED